MWYLDERAGTQDGYYAKMLHSETPSGRLAGWEMLQLVTDALFPDGIGVRLTGEPIFNDEMMRAKIAVAAARQERANRNKPPPEFRTHLRQFASAKEVQA